MAKSEFVAKMKYNSVIFSGLPGSGKSTLCSRLSKEKGWPIYSIGDLWRKEWQRLYPKGEKSFIDYWASTSREENLRMNVVAREIFVKGDVIGDSRYSIYCKDTDCLLVFITTELNIRAERAKSTGKYQSKSLEDIKGILLQREEDEVRTGRDLFGKDYDYRDKNNYHLVLNSGILTIEEEFKIIADILAF
jgi:cytidylate kinase